MIRSLFFTRNYEYLLNPFSQFRHRLKPLVTLAAFIIFLLSSFTSIGQTTLTVHINELKNNKGQIVLDIQDENKNSVKAVFGKIENNSCTMRVENLKPGKYVFRYFHDENIDKELNTNLIGMPKEGFGFSNNAKGKFGPPKHEKTIFQIKSDTTLICIPIYL